MQFRYTNIRKIKGCDVAADLVDEAGNITTIFAISKKDLKHYFRSRKIQPL